MTSTPPRVFDCDMHVLEPADLWQHYLEPEFKDHGPVGFSEHPLDFRISLFGNVLAAGSRPDADEWRRERLELLGEQIARGFDAVSQLMAMDVEGVERTVLFPSRGLMAMGIDYDDTRLAAAIASAYNNWLAEFCRQDPARLMGAAVLSPHDPNEAVIEARRAKEKLGFRAIHLRPNPVRGRNWYDPAYTPLWAECEALDLPVGFHEGGVALLPQAVAERFADRPRLRWITGHVVSHPVEMMYAMVCLISGGVLDNFPKLRVAFLEANSAWVPYFLWRLDEHLDHEHARSGWKPLRCKASEYFKRQLFTSMDAHEDVATAAVEALGDNNIMFSTDFPHADSPFPHAVETFMKLPLKPETQRKILWDNPMRFYGFRES